jgi:thioredoxin reductase/Fe-S-cluster-containing hydrogenase component 2/CRP-like cAMP-binding protein
MSEAASSSVSFSGGGLDHVEVAVIGAGPAGLGAATNAAHHKLSHVLIERRELGNTVFDYQLGKLVMAEPAKLPLRSHVPFKQGSREEILEGWAKAVQGLGVNVVRAEVTKIERKDDKFYITTNGGSLTATNVVLAIGVQGTPRKLGVPGEDLPHVAYTLADPGAFKGYDVMVVGAGDAAIENALALADKNTVSLLNRGAEFPRAKEANGAKIMDAIRAGKVRHFMNSSVARVESDVAYIDTPDGEVALKCNHIIARLGGILPRGFLEGIGIQFSSKDPNAVPIVNGRYESSVPNLFVLGALIGYPLIKHAINQGHEVIEHILGNKVEPADQVLIDEKLKVLPGSPNDNLAMMRAKLPLFKDLSDAQFRELVIDSTVHQLAPGSVVFKRNDYTDSFFSIVSGEVTVQISPERGIPIGESNFFGEMGLLSGRRRVATIVVSKSAVLLESPRKQLLKLTNSVPSVKRSLDEVFMLRALETSVFPDADPAFLRELVKKARMKNFKKGDVLFKEGDMGDVLYVIRKGSLKVSRKNKRGADVTQTYVPAGHIVGEMALLSAADAPRSATVTAAVACETIILGKEEFLHLLDENPRVRKRVEELARMRQVENVVSEKGEQTGQLLDFMMTEGVTDADNILLIDSDLCVGCDNCEKACEATHHGFSRLDRKGGKSLANIQIPISCRHCENPLCMTDCPPDALTRLPDGEVIIRDSCIGCGNCVRSCPYGVIQLVHDHPDHGGFSLLRLFGLGKKSTEEGPAKAAKCDQCESLKGGPACVRACPTGAAMRVNPRRLLELVGKNRGKEG